ncbi:MAG: hypothetical protein GF350_15340, partial [Chitinivibrionales bacterium]|nr:hypothetical protein [Chitinivibrionales bacterium]
SLDGTPVETKTEPYLGLNWTSEKNVRLTGSIVPLYTSEYRFDSQVRGAIKVWVDGSLVVDGQKSGGDYKILGERIFLEAGVPYSIKVEATGGSAVSVDWWCPEMPLHVIPQHQLYPVEPGSVGSLSKKENIAPATPSIRIGAKVCAVHIPRGAGAYTIRLMRSDGSVVASHEGIRKATYTIPTVKYGAGIYMLSIKMAHQTMIQRFVISR